MSKQTIKNHIFAFKSKNLSHFGITKTLSKENIAKYAIKNLALGIKKNDKTTIIKQFILGAYSEESYFLKYIFKEKLLRSSRYNFNPPTSLVKAITEINAQSEMIDISSRIKKYIRSIKTLLDYSDSARYQYDEIVQFISHHKEKFIKTIMASIEILFTTDYAYDHNQPTSHIGHYSKEQLSEAASFLIYIHRDKHGEMRDHLNSIEDNYLLLNQYCEILVKACILKKYYYMEIKVEKLPYQVTLQNNTPTLQAIDDEFEKFLRFGYLNNEFKEAELTDTKNKGRALSLLSFPEKSKILHEKCITLDKTPTPRYTFKVPEEYLELITTFLDRDKLFFEEICLIKQIIRDYHVDEDTFIKFTLRDNITITDLILFKRIIFLLTHPFYSFLQDKLEHGTTNEKMNVVRSIIPTFEISRFVDLISNFMDKDIVENIVDMLSYPGRNRIFDFQYTPFIKINNHIMLPVSTFIKSNTIRNSLLNEQRRFFEDNKKEPLVSKTLSCLEKCMDFCRANVEYSHGKISGEIDVLGIKDGCLFTFEVKNSLLPCSPAELRTTFDHIEHGAHQLIQFKELIQNDTEFYDKFKEEIKAPDFSRDSVHQCIISGNRLLSGYKHRGILICFVHNILNYFSTGKAVIGDRTENMWSGSLLSSTDIINYLNDSPYQRINIQFMQEYNHTYKIADKEFCIKSFFFNAKAAQEYYDARFSESFPTR
jgi:hypothetical protein